MAIGNRRRSWVVAMAAFCLAIVIGGAFVRLVSDRRTAVTRRSAQELAHLQADRLENAFQRAFSALDILAAVVRDRGTLEGSDLRVPELPAGYGPFESIQLAPAGVVSRVLPAAMSAADVGRNLFYDPVMRPAIEEARAKRRTTLAGPVRLSTRKTGLVGCAPVFLPGTGSAARDRFWGFVLVAIAVPDLLSAVQIDELVSGGYDYQVSIAGFRGGRKVVIARSRETAMDQAVISELELPHGNLGVAVEPRGGWQSSSGLTVQVILVFIGAVLVSLSSYQLAREPETLRKEVESRRRRLTEATQKLQSEITQRESVEQQLQHDSTHDALTQLPNRVRFLEMLQTAMTVLQQLPKQRIAVFFIDIDRMKQINDSLGHVVGDTFLVGIGERLRAAVRGDDILARIGGDEFGVMIAESEEGGATIMADRLLREVRKPFTLNGVEVVSSASIGIAYSDPKQGSADELLNAAAAANHQAKSQGRARWVVYEQAMRDRALHLVQLEADLRHALVQQQFLVYYEPVVSLKTRRITGFEALVRWKHPVRGLVSPGEFIPLAEETGLVVSIDRWVLMEAARTLKEWHDTFKSGAPLTISVNLSGAELTQPDVVDQVASTLRATTLDPDSLKMELTESSVVGNPGAAASVLQRLRDLGVHLSLDDFGTGYSSFQYVQQFPFDTVKIDRSFVKDVHVEKKSREIVGTITRLSHNLGMDVVAEGVDNAEQLPYLWELGCDYAQGWLFSKPQDKAAAQRLIESGPVW